MKKRIEAALTVPALTRLGDEAAGAPPDPVG
jgi:hypothetical protein